MPRGTMLGRYILLERLGAGGMGVVYAAYDPELDRKVAVKILHDDRGSDERQLRLTREAQAMARLSHPNVIAVHDVGVANGAVFVAMELVDGSTLSAWRKAAPRRWREVVQVFLAAGHGLAAAHRAGLVHRDFKPDNVLLRADDHHVLVSDFGLVRLADEAPLAAVSDARTQPSSLERSLTHAGALLGTPAYMAPEMHRGEPADARSDQFAFCVALYEALYDERPFAAASGDGLDTLDALAVEMMKGNVRPAPRTSEVPGWLRKLVVRGLAPAPGDRWPTMDALLVALRRDPAQRRRGLLVGGTAGAVIIGLAITAVARGQSDEPICEGGAERVAAAWNPASRADGAAAFLATGKPFAADVWHRAEQGLDDYAASWAAMHGAACEATEVRHEQSAELLDLRMACLDHALGAFAALTTLFRTADVALLSRAIQATAALPRVAGCADVAALRALVPLPDDPVARARIDAVEQKLAKVVALDGAGRWKEGVAAVAPLIEEARAIGYAVPIADALYLRVHMQQSLHTPRTSEPTREAIEASAAAHQDERTVQLVTALEWALMSEKHTSDGLVLVPIADGLLKRAGSPPRMQILVVKNHGLLLQAAGDYEQADALLREAETLQQQLDPHEGELAGIRVARAGVLVNQAHYAEARGELDRALELMTALYGPDNANIAIIYLNRGNASLFQHDVPAAARDYRAALAIAEANSLETDVTSILWMNIGITLSQEGKWTESEDAYQRALAIRIKITGPESEAVGSIYENLAGLWSRAKQLDKALDYAKLAIATKEKALGPMHDAVGNSYATAGDILLGMSRPAEAKELFARAVEIDLKTLPPDHPHLVDARLGLAQSLTDLHQPATAIPLIQLAITSIDAKDAKDPLRADARYTLGKAMWELGTDRRAARAKVEEARVLYEQLATSSGEKQSLAKVVAWLAKHPI